jgi:transcriptional regulator with XRE-family HTH domain
MKLHRNAMTCPHSRRLLVARIEREGWTLAQAAEASGISVRAAAKWLRPFRAEGEEGLLDRSSAPLRVPRHTPEHRVSTTQRGSPTWRCWTTSGRRPRSLSCAASSTAQKRIRDDREERNLEELRVPASLLNPASLPTCQFLANAEAWRRCSGRSRAQELAVSSGFSEADDGVRTRDPQLGKLMLYQLSYVRVAIRIAQEGR